MRIDRKIRIVIISILCLSAAGSSAMLASKLGLPGIVQGEKVLFNYVQKAAFDYSVNITQGPLFPSAVVGPGAVYFENVVTSISTRAQYSLETSPRTPIKGESAVVGYLRAYDSTEPDAKPIWEMEYTLLEAEPFLEESGVVHLDRGLEIDIAKYSGVIDSLFALTEVRPVRAALSLEWRASAASLDGHSVGGQVVRKITIPVTAKYFSISSEPAAERTGSVTLPVDVKDAAARRSRALWGTAAALLTAAAIGACLYTRPYDTHNPHAKALQATMAKFSGRVARSVSEPPSACQVVGVASAEDLARIADDLGKPVLSFSMAEPPGAILFFVVDGDIRYDYMFAGHMNADRG